MNLTQFFNNRCIAGRNPIDEFQLLKAMPGSPLCVDVGAHIGIVTERYLKQGCRCISFEPNPANLNYFEQRLQGWGEKLELHRAAVSNHDGEAVFHVPNKVVSGVGICGDFEGSSATGGFGTRFKSVESYSVKTVRLDSVIKEPIDFLKVDVQGFERDVILGAEGLLSKGMVSYMLMEFQGDVQVLDLIADNGFYIFDAELFQTADMLKNSVYEGMPVTIHSEGTLSTGNPFRRVLVDNRPKEFAAYSKFASSFVRWTDLLCVHESKLIEFLQTAEQLGEG